MTIGLLENNKMEIKSTIKAKIYSYYLKRGMIKAIKDLEKKHEANGIDIPKLLSDVNALIIKLKEEVDLYSKALEVIEGKYGKIKEASEIATVFPFLDLSFLDILILHKLYINTTDSVEKNFICRTSAQHMYEFLEDGSKVLGKQMDYIIRHLNNTQITNELTALRKAFNKLKKELHTPLKELRHNVSGHKDRDIQKQLLISNTIDLIDFQRNFILFMLFFVQLTKFKKLVQNEIIQKQKNSSPKSDSS